MFILRDMLIALRLSIKAKFAWMAVGALLVLTVATVLSAYFGGRQPATVALDIGFSIIRLVLPLIIVLLVQELLSREFDKRYFLSSLTFPRARSSLLLGRFAAVLALVLGILLFLGLVQMSLVRIIGGIYPQATSVALGQAYVVVVTFMALDLLVLAALATLLAVVASTPSFVLIGTFGFMLVARSYGAIIELLGHQVGLVNDAEGYRASLGILGYLLPDLGALDMRMLALYNRPEFLPSDWPWLFFSGLAYAIGLLALSVLALHRKRLA